MKATYIKISNLRFICLLIILFLLLLLLVTSFSSCKFPTYIVTDESLNSENNITLSGEILTKEVEKDFDKSEMQIHILKLDNPISIIYKSNFGYEEKVDNVDELQIKYLIEKNLVNNHMEITGEIKSGKNKSFGRDSYTDFILVTNYYKEPANI